MIEPLTWRDSTLRWRDEHARVSRILTRLSVFMFLIGTATGFALACAWLP